MWIIFHEPGVCVVEGRIGTLSGPECLTELPFRWPATCHRPNIFKDGIQPDALFDFTSVPLQTAPVEVTNAPPLDRIPTNEFIERFLENEESKPRRSSSCRGLRSTEQDRRSSASASTSSTRAKAKTKQKSDKADDLETILDITGKSSWSYKLCIFDIEADVTCRWREETLR